MNPMNLESSKPSQKQKLEMLGAVKDVAAEVVNDIVEYFSLQKPKEPFLLALKGEIGSGKSLFARCLIDNLNDNIDYKNLFDDNFEGKLPFFCSSLNCES